jgi:hypothetical protein
LQRLALAGALGGHERVAADHQPLAGEMLLSTISARFCWSSSDSCSCPSRTSFFTWGALSAVIQATSWSSAIASRLALVTMPRSETTTIRRSLKRRRSFSSWAGSVLSSCSEPAKTSTAIGRPRRSQSRPKTICGVPRFRSRE